MEKETELMILIRLGCFLHIFQLHTSLCNYALRKIRIDILMSYLKNN